MKKYILALFFTFLCFQINYGQIAPPGCECCAGLAGPELTACLTACDEDPEGDFCSDPLPIDSNILVLLALGISFGGYSVYQNKKDLSKTNS
ncbi:hypothetical protein [Flavobacterium sp. SM2513]|uniref:hypothetical protein n=1 Tax=Flavobacterium sp. SM2513 TaxID=3424766 RepID=UPI003D7FC10D